MEGDCPLDRLLEFGGLEILKQKLWIHLTDDESTDDESTDDESTEDESTEDESTEDDSTEDESTEDEKTDDKSVIYRFRKWCPPIEGHQKLVIPTLDNESDVESKTQESDKRSLKFRRFGNYEAIVEFNKKTKMEIFTGKDNEYELMLYNFRKMEHFCKKIEKRDYSDENDKINSRFYVLVKDFSDEKINVPGKKAHVYGIGETFKPELLLGISFTVYANGDHDEHIGYVVINFQKITKIIGQTVLYISIIDNEGNERFTQTEILTEKNDNICGTEMINNDLTLCKLYISRETIMCNPLELLHGDDLFLCISREYARPIHVTETETKINYSFKQSEVGMYELFLDSDVGSVLCKNSNFFQNKLKETKIVLMREGLEITTFKNICRLLLGASFIQVFFGFDSILHLYQMSQQYEIVAGVEFCRRVFKKHSLYVKNIPLMLNLAISYKDVFLGEIARNSLKFHKKYEIFNCNFFNFAGLREESQMDDFRSKHIHYARGEYIECDNYESTNQQYCSFNANCKEVESKLHFSSVFIECENNDIILPLDSHFGKILIEKSNVLKDMLACTCLESQEDNIIKIPQKNFGAFKNIYRLFMGANYIKAITIFDVISLYELCDYYNIPLVMEMCRNIFKKHICIRNYKFLLDLSKICRGDIELEKIVLNFNAEYEKYVSGRRHPEWLNDNMHDNFVELDEILGFEHNFNAYQ